MSSKSRRTREDEHYTVDTRLLSQKELHQLIPRQLYKYGAVNSYFLKGLENHELWFSSPLDFNDPFDCKVNLNYGRTKKQIAANFAKLFIPGKADPELDLDELYEKFLAKPGSFENILNEITKYTLGEKLGVCCFSERNDHILMWSHYAARHSGICLQFNTRRRGLIHDNVLPVQYYNKYPDINLASYSKEQLTAFYYHAICAKSDLWDTEFEWRAIIAEGARMTHQYALKDLTGIIFGVNTSTEDFTNIDKIISALNFPNIQYYKAEMGKAKYQLHIRKLI